MRRDLMKEFEDVRKKMEEKGSQLGFQHPLVLELSRRLDQLHNELMKKEREKKESNKASRLHTIFEAKMAYDYYVSVS